MTALVLTDVLDPLTGEREDVTVTPPEGWPGATVGRRDGSALWVLPGLYDADQHWPVPDTGIRQGDRWRCLVGGSLHVNTAYSWDRLPASPAEVAAGFDRLRFPQTFPVLSVPHEGSEGFADWVRAHAAELRDTWPPVCKLYTLDPHVERNIEAVWEAGLRAVVYCWEDHHVEDMVALTGGPLHFRHATSAALLARMKARPDSTVQTSPHFLLEVDPDQAAQLHVLPPVPGEPDRSSLLGVLEQVEMVGTDHNAPILGNEGPGLDVATTLLPAVVTLADEVPGGLAALLPKVTTGPAEVFGTAGRLVPTRLVVDPAWESEVRLDPGQEARRAPYLGRTLKGTVVATISEDRGFLL